MIMWHGRSWRGWELHRFGGSDIDGLGAVAGEGELADAVGDGAPEAFEVVGAGGGGAAGDDGGEAGDDLGDDGEAAVGILLAEAAAGEAQLEEGAEALGLGGEEGAAFSE